MMGNDMHNFIDESLFKEVDNLGYFNSLDWVQLKKSNSSREAREHVCL